MRLAEHKQYIRSKILDNPSGWHFNQQGHELSHLAGLELEHVKSSDPFVLRARVEQLFGIVMCLWTLLLHLDPTLVTQSTCYHPSCHGVYTVF
jgi:hypothetical protein